ncbi:MAG: hypothetical protein AAFX39_15595 [Pseudomonadota bacterium]
MSDVDKALLDVARIRSQLAAGTVFQGFGPAVIASTGLLAGVAALAQSLWPQQFAASDRHLLLVWIAVAMLAATLIGLEMIARARRHHGGLADAMLLNAVEVFLPAGFAGAAIAAVVMMFAADQQWMLPGLWQIFLALGIFSALRSLPRTVAFAAGWYFLSGICVLLVASDSRTLDPWMMGFPFLIGQLGLAWLLHSASDETNEL